jgi:UDP-N-acetylglucosamine--N-acetylmuramyl-(pentapeptide) pyrophosphoryl-undecaprenol N-acetylglucosamine transferase
VVFSGGGTGGHLYPALALARALVELRPEVRPFFVGARRGIEARVLPDKGLPHELLPVVGVRRGRGLANWRVLPALASSLARIHRLFRRLRPGLVVVTGGYAGAPAGLGAVAHRLPLALQEQNSVPGITTRLLSRWADQVHLAFPEAGAGLPAAARTRVRESGNPVRPPSAMEAGEARRALGLAPGGSVVLVVGGSQGSAALNARMIEAVKAVESGSVTRPPGLQLLWSTGPRHLGTVRDALEPLPSWVVATGYIEAMEEALAAADLAVSRAGAMATSEFLAWGTPMVLLPLPTAAADHQARNAEALATAGAALHLPEAGLTGVGLWEEVRGLVEDRGRLTGMAEAARGRGHPGAATEIARALAELLPHAPGRRP